MTELEQLLGLGRFGRHAFGLNADGQGPNDEFSGPGLSSLGIRPSSFGTDRRRSRRWGLDDDITPDFETALRQRVREMPPENVESSPHGALQWFFETLDLPRNAIANLIGKAMGVKPRSKMKAFGLQKVGTSDLLRRAGLNFDDRSTGGKIGNFVTGFLGDVALDPLTYLTFGTSAVAGTAGKAIGKQVFTEAGERAVESALQKASQRIAARGAAAAKATGASADAAKLAGEARLGRFLEELGQRPIQEARRTLGMPPVEGAAGGLARQFAEQQGLTRMRARVAEGVARKADRLKAGPTLLDRNAIGFSTRPLREFSPLDLPMLAAHIPTAMVSRKGAEALSRAYAPIRKVTQPFRYLPDVQKTLVTREQFAKLGLGKLAGRIGQSPFVAPFLRAGGEVQREVLKRFSTNVVPPRPGDAADRLRYETELLNQFVDAEISRRARTVSWAEGKKLKEWTDKAAEIAGIPRDVAAEVIFDVTERLGSNSDPQELIESVRSIVQSAGHKPEQADRLVQLVEEAIPELAPARDKNLFGDEIIAPLAGKQGSLFPEQESRRAGEQGTRPPSPEISDGLRGSVASILRELPGRTRPDADLVRRALIEKHGSGQVQKWLRAKLRGGDWQPELDEAIDQATKGLRLFDEPELAPAGPRREIGQPVRMIDSDRNAYEGTLEVVDAKALVASHRPRKLHGDVIGLDAQPDFPAGFQARNREGAASVQQVAQIAKRPEHGLLLEFGQGVTDGPPVVWRRTNDEGRMTADVVLAGNGRVAGMWAWTKKQWAEYRAALEQVVGPIPPEIRQPVLVRRLTGDEAAARTLAALSQKSPTLAESRIERARAALGALGVKSIEAVPSFRVSEPVTRENVEKFLFDNPPLDRWLTAGLTPQRQAELKANPEELALRVNDVFTALLPPGVQRLAAGLPDKLERMFTEAAPLVAYTHSLRQRGVIRPEYDLYEGLEQAAAFYQTMRGRRVSYSKMVDELFKIASTPTFAGMEDALSGLTRRGAALAVGFERASRAANPSQTLLDSLNKVIEAAKADNPRQMGLIAADPGAVAGEVFLDALLPPATAQQLRQTFEGLAGRGWKLEGQVAGGMPTQTAVGMAPERMPTTGAEGLPPAPGMPTPGGEGMPPTRQRLYQEINDTWTKRQWDPRQREGLLRVLDHFSDDSLATLEVRTATARQAQAARTKAEKRLNVQIGDPPAWFEKLPAGRKAEVQARGVIRLFRRSQDYDDLSVFLEELGHHLHRNVLDDADRAVIRQWYESRAPGEWEAILQQRGTPEQLAGYYTRVDSELFTRYFSDYVMGREIDADPAMQGLFRKVLDRLAALWRDLIGTGQIGTDRRIAEIIDRHYMPGGRDAATQGRSDADELGRQLGIGKLSLERESRPLFDAPPVQPELPGMPAAGAEGMPPQEMPSWDRVQLADPVREMVGYLQGRAGLRIGQERAAGVPARELTTERGVRHLVRMMIDSKDSKLGQLVREVGFKIGSRYQMRRAAEWREQFASEANRLIDAGNARLRAEARERGGPLQRLLSKVQSLGSPRIQMDPAVAHLSRELESVKMVGSAEFLKEAARRFGVRVAEGGPPAGFVFANAKQFGDLTREFAFPPEVARLLEEHVGRWKQPDKLLSAYDRLLSLWKGWVLVAPAYHLRNLWGNVWNSRLADAWSPGAFDTARNMQRAIATGEGLATNIKGLKGETFESLYTKLVTDYGVVGSGFYGMEVGTHADAIARIIESVERPAGRRKFWEDLKGLHWLKANQTLGQLGEEASKIAFVITRMRKGDALPQAVEKMKRFLFDYADLTDFERNVMRRVIPFYAWTRKNAELLLQLAFTSPAKLAALPQVQMEAEAAFAGDEQLPLSMRPAHVAEEMGVQVSGGTRPKFLSMGYMLPIGEAKYVNPLAPVQGLKNLLEQAGGPAKIPLELAANRDFYFDRPISEYPGQRKTFLGVDVPPAVKHVARTLRPLNVGEQARRLVGSAEGLAGAATAAGSAATGVRAFDVSVSGQVYEQERAFNEQIGAVRRDLRRRLSELPPASIAADGELQRLFAIHEQLTAQRDQLPRQEVRGLGKEMSQRRRELLEQYLETARANSGL